MPKSDLRCAVPLSGGVQSQGFDVVTMCARRIAAVRDSAHLIKDGDAATYLEDYLLSGLVDIVRSNIYYFRDNTKWTHPLRNPRCPSDFISHVDNNRDD